MLVVLDTVDCGFGGPDEPRSARTEVNGSTHSLGNL